MPEPRIELLIVAPQVGFMDLDGSQPITDDPLCRAEAFATCKATSLPTSMGWFPTSNSAYASM
jgi:hypothetical protein